MNFTAASRSIAVVGTLLTVPPYFGRVPMRLQPARREYPDDNQG
jgi:hypothetical protein